MFIFKFLSKTNLLATLFKNVGTEVFLASIAGTAGGVFGVTVLNSIQDKLNTIDMRIDYLHGAIIGDVFAEAKIIKNGKTIIKADIELFQNNRKDPVAIARCAYSVLRNEY